MRRAWTLAGLAVMAVMALALAGLALNAQEKSKGGPLTGTWDCQSHGGDHGDTPFTLELEQDGEKVTGSVSSAEGGMDITTATFKDNVLEIHLDTPDGLYVLKAALKDGALSGDTTRDGAAMGKWEGKKSTQK